MEEDHTQHSDQLFSMANQIADNLRHGRTEEETIDSVALHIRKFWSRSMKESLCEEGLEGDSLNPIARSAAGILAEDYSDR